MSADLLRLGEQVGALAGAGARWFHVDIMDAHFVPNLTLGTEFVRQLSAFVRERGGALDAEAISVHVEADPHPHRLLQEIRGAGRLAGLAINPGTPVGAVDGLAESVDYVNCMSVNPGFSGQSFIAQTPVRIRALRDRLPPEVAIEVDGGVGADNVASLLEAGATMLVSASSIFQAADPVRAYGELAGRIR
jgi:ribulose-phosphate 3-epimerase